MPCCGLNEYRDKVALKYTLSGGAVFWCGFAVVLIIGALLAMQIYVKRGAMGKLKDATDQIGEQFSPAGASYKINREYNARRDETLSETGQLNTTLVFEKQNRWGNETRADNLANETLF